jgi:acyl CoA:acetate/3-ketoacid CoA transferase beta subunit
MASRLGAMVTVEKIVSTDFIRRHSHLVKLPGQYVRSLSEVPYGGHPSKHPKLGEDVFEGYGEDYPFIAEAKKAAQSEDTLNAWIDRWVLGCPDHGEYLRRLGPEKLLKLKGKIHQDSWEWELRDLKENLSESPEYTPIEMAIVVAARLLGERIKKAGYQTLLCGAGMANLAGWLAYYQLREGGVDLDLMAEAGMFGYAPRPGDPTTFNSRNFPSCKMLTDVHQVMGLFMGGARNQCIGSLGAGQIDRLGNINTTQDSNQKVFMVGSGGANDIASSAREILVTAWQRKESFVEKVPYITSPGAKVRILVSNLGVFEKPEGTNALVLTGIFPHPQCRDREEAVRHLQSRLGWELQVAKDLVWIEAPTLGELRMLRIFDPHRYYLGKL